MKYNKAFKMNCIEIGECTIGDAAKQRQIPKQTIARWIRLYKKYGEAGLENKKPGVIEKPIDSIVESDVLRLWNEKKRAAYKMLRDLRIRDGNKKISKRQIEKIYKKNNLKIKETQDSSRENKNSPTDKS